MSKELPNPVELYRTFADSEFGQQLEQNSRFGVFKPEWTPTAMWTDLLGDDVNNLYHMSHTYELAKTYTMYEGLGQLATNYLLTTAATHDWGEAKIGDIPLPDKTNDDEKLEKLAYKEIACELLGGTLGEKLTNTVWPILEHHEKNLGDRFRSIEYIGYCTTAMRAGRVATRLVHGLQHVKAERSQKDQLVSGLLGLERAVEVGNYKTLAEYVAKYPSIEDQLRNYHG